MKDPNELRNLISALVGQRKFDQARTELFAAHANQQDNAEILLMLGSVDMMAGKLTASKFWLEKSNQIVPGNTICLVLLGSVCEQLQMVDEAIAHFKSAIALNPDIPQARILLSRLLKMKMDNHGAIEQLDHELRLRPNNASVLANLALIYDQVNQYDKSAEAAAHALELQPGHIGAMLALANVEKFRGNYAEAEALYRRIAVSPDNEDQFCIAQTQLGHVLDKQGRYDEAFQASDIGNTARKRSAARQGISACTFQDIVRDTANWTRRNPDKLCHAMPSDVDSGQAPLFFVGFPRSGTTLLEQILEQHPKIVSSREYPFIDKLIVNLPLKTESGEGYPYFLDNLDEEHVRTLRLAYRTLASSQIEELSDDSILLDKLPLNIVYLPFIARLFPKSKILVALRDPRDVCLSCYQQAFGLNSAMANFLDLETTGKLYADVMGLWIRFRSVLGLNWMEYRYEDLVDNFDSVTHRIFDFLELEYPEKAGDYYKRAKRNILTPSYHDVSKPIYTHAKARWRYYKKHLEPLDEILAPFVEAFQYSKD